MIRQRDLTQFNELNWIIQNEFELFNPDSIEKRNSEDLLIPFKVGSGVILSAKISFFFLAASSPSFLINSRFY